MATQPGGEDESASLIPGSSNCDSVDNGAVASTDHHFTGRRQKLLVTLCILVTELCERLTFYGLTANLVLFCSSELDLESPWPSIINYLFQGWFNHLLYIVQSTLSEDSTVRWTCL